MTKKTTSPEFISLDEAAKMKEGTRITFVPGIQAIYAEALKNICYVKKIKIIRVLHPFMGIDKNTGKDRQARLYELTSQTSLPTMFHDEERPRNVWVEQLGLVWNMRILSDGPLARKYGYSDDASSKAPSKMAEIVKVIDRQLEKQQERGSKYLIGDKISAVDIYWSTISMTILPASLEIMPKTKQNEGMLFFFEANSKIPEIKEVLTDRILSHRDYILKTYCETPAVLGGDPI